MSSFFISQSKILIQNKLQSSLKKVFGINNSKINALINFYGLKKNIKINKLPTPFLIKIKNFYETENNKYSIDENLKLQKTLNVKKLIRIRSRKGIRHSFALPVNGQRTRSNHKTCKKLFEFKYIIKKVTDNTKIKKRKRSRKRK